MFQIFGRRNSSGNNIAEKIPFQISFWAKAIFINPVNTGGLEMLIFFALFDGTPIKWAVCCDNICRNFLSASFCQKSGIFWILFQHIWHSPLPTTFCNCDVFFLQTPFVRSICLLVSCLSKVVFVRSLNFWWTKYLRRRVLGESNWKHIAFLRRKVKFCSSFLAWKTHVWHLNNAEATEYESLVAFNFWPKFFLSFPKDYPRKLYEKEKVLNKNTAFSKVMHVQRAPEMHITWIEEQMKKCTQQWVLMEVSTPSELFAESCCRKFWIGSFSEDRSTLP